MNNDFSKTSSEITKLKQAVSQYRHSLPKEPLGSDLFVPESATVKSIQNFMEATVSAIDELSEQIESSEQSADEARRKAEQNSKRTLTINIIMIVLMILTLVATICMPLLSE